MLTYDSLFVNSFVECGTSGISWHSFFQTGFTPRGAGMDCQDVFLVFHFDRDRVGNWLRVTAFAGLLGLWVLWIDSASSHNISFKVFHRLFNKILYGFEKRAQG